VILRTAETFFGQLARQIAGRRVPTAFDQASTDSLADDPLILVMVPTVSSSMPNKHDWLEALLFAWRWPWD